MKKGERVGGEAGRFRMNNGVRVFALFTMWPENISILILKSITTSYCPVKTSTYELTTGAHMTLARGTSEWQPPHHIF